MEDLVARIAQTSQITAEQASVALGTVLRFLGSRLPSPVMGRIQEALKNDQQPDVSSKT